MHEAFKLGINFFDTSPYYGDTRSEQVQYEDIIVLGVCCQVFWR